MIDALFCTFSALITPCKDPCIMSGINMRTIIIKDDEVISATSGSRVNTLTIKSSSKIITIWIMIIMAIEMTLMSLKYSLAKETRFAPIYSPIIAHAADCMPIGTMNKIAITLSKIVLHA